eukprot:gene4984-6073_t
MSSLGLRQIPSPRQVGKGAKDIFVDWDAGTVSVRAVCTAIVANGPPNIEWKLTAISIVLSNLVGGTPLIARAFLQGSEDYTKNPNYIPATSALGDPNPICMLAGVLQALLLVYYVQICTIFMMGTVNDLRRRAYFLIKLGEMMSIPSGIADHAADDPHELEPLMEKDFEAQAVRSLFPAEEAKMDFTQHETVLGWIACRRILQEWKRDLQIRLQIPLLFSALLCLGILIDCVIQIVNGFVVPISGILTLTVLLAYTSTLITAAIVFGHKANNQARHHLMQIAKQTERMIRLRSIQGLQQEVDPAKDLQLARCIESLHSVRDTITLLDSDHPITLL